jgi:hypothetical protein
MTQTLQAIASEIELISAQMTCKLLASRGRCQQTVMALAQQCDGFIRATSTVFESETEAVSISSMVKCWDDPMLKGFVSDWI